MEIKLLPSDFETAHKELEQVKSELETCKNELEVCYRSMKENWLGSGGNAFEQYYSGFFTQFESNLEKLEQLCADIKTSMETMDSADQKVSQQLGTP